MPSLVTRRLLVGSRRTTGKRSLVTRRRPLRADECTRTLQKRARHPLSGITRRRPGTRFSDFPERLVRPELGRSSNRHDDHLGGLYLGGCDGATGAQPDAIATEPRTCGRYRNESAAKPQFRAPSRAPKTSPRRLGLRPLGNGVHMPPAAGRREGAWRAARHAAARPRSDGPRVAVAAGRAFQCAPNGGASKRSLRKPPFLENGSPTPARRSEAPAPRPQRVDRVASRGCREPPGRRRRLVGILSRHAPPRAAPKSLLSRRHAPRRGSRVDPSTSRVFAVLARTDVAATGPCARAASRAFFPPTRPAGASSERR
jgi:hypothetical protein